MTVYLERNKIQVVHLQMVEDDEVIYGEKVLDDPKEAVALIRSLIESIHISIQVGNVPLAVRI